MEKRTQRLLFGFSVTVCLFFISRSANNAVLQASAWSVAAIGALFLEIAPYLRGGKQLLLAALTVCLHGALLASCRHSLPFHPAFAILPLYLVEALALTVIYVMLVDRFGDPDALHPHSDERESSRG